MIRRLSCIAFVVLLACSASIALPASARESPAKATVPGAPAADSVLVLGRISDDPKAHHDQLKPLLDYVLPRMADVASARAGC